MTTVPPPPRHERTLRVLRIGSLVSVAPVIVFSIAQPAVATGILPGGNPPANVAPTPDFTSSGTCTSTGGAWRCTNPCVTGALSFPAFTEGKGCAAYVLAAIDVARKAEKVGPLLLPTNWQQLDPQEQLFVLADLERTGRGLPPYLGLNRALSTAAQRAAQTDSDPTFAPGFAVGLDASGVYGMGGTWSTGFSPLVADYFWMYDDGWGGTRSRTTNVACTSRTAAGCWAHRDELLGADPHFNPGVGLGCRTCEMGTGFAMVAGHASMTDLIELPAGSPPAMTFTWARDVAPYLPHATTTHATTRASRVVLRDAVHTGTWTPWSSSACRTTHVPPSPVGHGGSCHHGLHAEGQVATPSEREE